MEEITCIHGDPTLISRYHDTAECVDRVKRKIITSVLLNPRDSRKRLSEGRLVLARKYNIKCALGVIIHSA